MAEGRLRAELNRTTAQLRLFAEVVVEGAYLDARIDEPDPDYVVLGEARPYSFEAISKAIRPILGGSRFICTNPDTTGKCGT